MATNVTAAGSTATTARTRVELAGLVSRMMEDRPTFHRGADGEELCWNALPGTLTAIAEHVEVGSSTIETGCGASTVVFAAAGVEHTVISADSYEHGRVRAYCEQIGVSHERVRFIEGMSDDLLPALDLDPLQFVFIDGGHAFPYAVIDWHYTARALRDGGYMLLDDVPIPAVRVVHDHLDADPAWRHLDVLDHRAGLYQKVGPYPEPMAPWREQPFNRRYPDYSFLDSPVARMHEASLERVHRMRTRAAANPTAKRVFGRLKGAARR